MIVKPVILSPSRHPSTPAPPPPFAPTDIGLPDKFREWRPNQFAAVERILDSDKRFVMLCLSTGSGKTAIYYTAALLSGVRTAVLTATKGLMDQIAVEMSTLSTDIRGQGNYTCPIADSFNLPRHTTVDDAPCQCGYRCRMKWSGGCSYYDQYRTAQAASIFSTNYQMWMHDSLQERANGDLQYGYIADGLGDVQTIVAKDTQAVKMLVCDEAHDADSQLTKFAGVDITRKECFELGMEWLGGSGGHSVDDWREWSAQNNTVITDKLEREKERLRSQNGAGWSRQLKRYRDMKRKLDKLSDMRVEDDWILTENQDRQNGRQNGKSIWSVRMDPLVPARYAEKILWRGVEKVVLVSATVRPKTAELLGINGSELDFIEFPSNFDPARRPFVVVPAIQLNRRTEQDDGKMRLWLARLDSVIDRLKHWKGVVHSVSYDRGNFILNNSRHSSIMVTHDTRNRAEMVELFKQMEAPAILVSPAVETGYDFRGDQARWQAVTKIPFASVTDPLIKARQDRDKDYGRMLATQKLMQAYGRSTRADDDWSVTVMMDGNFAWFYRSARKFMTRFFVEAVQWADGVNGIPDMKQFDSVAKNKS